MLQYNTNHIRHWKYHKTLIEYECYKYLKTWKSSVLSIDEVITEQNSWLIIHIQPWSGVSVIRCDC